MRCISQPRKRSFALCSLERTCSSKLPLIVPGAASFAVVSEYPEDVELGVYSGDAETRTPDRFDSGIKMVPRSGIADGGHHPSGDT